MSDQGPSERSLPPSLGLHRAPLRTVRFIAERWVHGNVSQRPPSEAEVDQLQVALTDLGATPVVEALVALRSSVPVDGAGLYALAYELFSTLPSHEPVLDEYSHFLSDPNAEQRDLLEQTRTVWMPRLRVMDPEDRSDAARRLVRRIKSKKLIPLRDELVTMLTGAA